MERGGMKSDFDLIVHLLPLQEANNRTNSITERGIYVPGNKTDPVQLSNGI